MEKRLLLTNHITEQRMKYSANRIKTPTMKIKFNHKMNQHQKHQQHRKANRNLCHTIRCHSYNQRKTTTRTLYRIMLKHESLNFVKKYLWFIILLTTLLHHVESMETTTRSSTTIGKSTTRYSQLLSTNGQMTYNNGNVDNINDDTFRPFIPTDPELVSRNVFTQSGQFRVFQPIDTDLRATVALEQRSHKINKMSELLSVSAPSFHLHMENQQGTTKQHMLNVNTTSHNNSSKQQQHHANLIHAIEIDEQRNEIGKQDDDLTSDLKSLEELLVEYVTNFFEKAQYEPMPGLLVELQNNHSISLENSQQDKIRKTRHIAATDAKVSIDLPRTLATGRLLFLTGLKKVLWPVFMGLQVLKSLLIAMFIPAIIGSFTKLLGKGITTGSAPLFIRPMEPPQELDFRDNSINFEDDNKFLVTDEGNKENGPYVYNQPDASQMNNQYVYNQAASSPVTFTRLGMNERQHQLMQDSYMSALQSIGSASFKNSGSLSSSSSGLLAPMVNKPPPTANVNTFQQFQKVPDSSLLLSNYDPFYSPLLSRLDSVFAQLKINSDNEVCREKLICLMYANPAKYAPYSNLVSAQLSRELNELRKPTSDNPDILRFFKYMRAAKDGQDGVDCENTFDKCTEFKDFENPAMVSTYHDINKLVQARKLT